MGPPERQDHDRYHRLLSMVLGGILVVGLLGLVVFVVGPLPATPAYTEFYVGNQTGAAAEYPATVAVGEEAVVTVGIVNSEHRRVTYELVVRSNETQFDRRSVTLAADEQWERELSLSFSEAGEQRVGLYLYVDEQPSGEPYRQLRLVFEVTQR